MEGALNTLAPSVDSQSRCFKLSVCVIRTVCQMVEWVQVLIQDFLFRKVTKNVGRK